MAGRVLKCIRAGFVLVCMFFAAVSSLYSAPLGNTNNKILLIVASPLYNDQTVRTALDVYRQDILLEGWSSEILLVDSSWTYAGLKQSIKDYYQIGYQGIFLIGSDPDIPTPFWEVHPLDAGGECPADLYYADMGDWFDIDAVKDGCFDSYYTKVENGAPVMVNGYYVADETRPANPANPFFSPELFFSRISPASIMDTYSISEEARYIVNYFAKIHKYRMTGGDLSWKISERGVYFQTQGGSETKALADLFVQTNLSVSTVIDNRSSNSLSYLNYLQAGSQFFRANAHSSGGSLAFDIYDPTTDVLGDWNLGQMAWFDFNAYASSFPYNSNDWEKSVSPPIYFYDMGHCNALRYANRVNNVISKNKNLGTLFLIKSKYMLNVLGASGSGGPETDIRLYEDLAQGQPIGLAFQRCLTRNTYNKTNVPKSILFGDPLIRYTIPPKGQYLSDMLPTSIANGWGTMQANKSIGGQTITIAKEQYPKGLGMHSYSDATKPAEILYCLDKKYSRFIADVGVDDECGVRGTVVFEVWGSTSEVTTQTRLFSSDLMRGGDKAKKVNVDVGGMKWLALKVTNGGDGNNSDHADWADAQVIKETYISDIPWVSAENGWGLVKSDKSTDNNTLSIKGQKYYKGLGVHAFSKIIYQLGKKYSRFTSDIGVDQESSTNGSVTFEVWGSYADPNTLVKLYDSGTVKGGEAAKKLDITVTDMEYLVLIVTNNQDGNNSDHADWANAKLTDNSYVVSNNYNFQEKYLSDLTWVNGATVNGWGPVKINKSVDDRTLSLNGRQYYKGLGAHANSEIVYQIGKKYEKFLADIGVDDETGTQGSVVFEVWGSTAVLSSRVKLFDSGTMRGSDPAKRVNVNIANMEYLILAARNNNDGITSDHADWADARVMAINNFYVTPVNHYISDLSWLSAQTDFGTVNKDLSCDKNTLKINNKVYAKGLGTHANSEIIYQIGKQYARFVCEVGVDAECQGQGSVVFEIWGSYGDQNNRFKLYESGYLKGTNDAKKVDIDVTNIEYLYLKATSYEDGINCDHADWADARLLAFWYPTDTTPEASWLSDLSYAVTPINGWGSVKLNKSTDNHTLTIEGVQYDKGLGAHSYSEIVYKVGKQYSRFTANVGVDDECGVNGTVVFEVWGSYTDVGSKFKLYDSGIMHGYDAAKTIDLNIANMDYLVLIVKDSGDGRNYDHADWGNPQVSRNGYKIANFYDCKPDQAPKITTDLRLKTATVGQLFLLTLASSDPEHDPMVLSVSGLPTGATLTGNTLSWTPAPSQGKQMYQMTAKLVDYHGRIYTEAFSIFVKQ